MLIITLKKATRKLEKMWKETAMAPNNILRIITFLCITTLGACDEYKFFTEQIEFWKKMMGDMEIPPPINCSLAHPPSTATLELWKDTFDSADTDDDDYTDDADVRKQTAEDDPLRPEDSEIKGPDKDAAADDDEPRKVMENPTTTLKSANLSIGYPRSTILVVAKNEGPPELFNEMYHPTASSLFFPGQDLKPGSKLELHFAPSKNFAPFLNFSAVDKSGAIKAALVYNSVNFADGTPTMIVDDKMEKDVQSMCNQPSAKGKNREKTCASDLIEMFNYTHAIIKSEIRPAATWLPEGKDPGKITYVVEKMKKLPVVHTVGCFKMSISFAMYFCQSLPKTVSFTMSLIGNDGSKVKALAVCHDDTLSWNAKSPLFEILKVQPGAKICHFLGADDLVWLPLKKEDIAV